MMPTRKLSETGREGRAIFLSIRMRIVILGLMLLLTGVARTKADTGQDTEVVSVTMGQSVTFIATAVASPPPTYQWLKDGIPLPTTGDTLRLPSVGAADAGNYSVIASNPAGSAMSNTAFLVVNAVVGGTGTSENQTPT